MHELPVTENILQITLHHAQQAGAIRVMHIYLVIGELASIVDESVQFYWPIVAQDTIAEGAKLHFRRIKTELLCLDCDYRYTPDGDEFSCPKCHRRNIKVITGKEFFVESIDVEENDQGE